MEIIRTQEITEPDLEKEFVRLNWVSKTAEELWAPIFSQCSNLFVSLEIEAVKRGLKGATIQPCAPDNLEKLSSEMMDLGLTVVPIERVGMTKNYSSSRMPVEKGRPWQYRVAIGDFESVREVVYGTKNGDTNVVGIALGYPQCCIDFFDKIWIREKWLDTSYPMSRGFEDYHEWNPYCNILLRWLGIRYISHLPCNFNCVSTEKVGREYHELAYDMGYRTVADALFSILNWPVQWSGLHGIGMIETPVCRVVFRTDMFNQKRTVRLHSDHYPRESALGLHFPHRTKMHNDNGFSSYEMQQHSHNVILDLVRHQPPESVIDLGCGDGALLRKMKADFGCEIFGVDDNEAKKPDLFANIWTIDDFPRDFDICLLSKARIRENPEGWYFLLNIIEKRCKCLLLYSYDGDCNAYPTGAFTVLIGIHDSPVDADLYGRFEAAKL
jgi:hypothetical protein